MDEMRQILNMINKLLMNTNIVRNSKVFCWTQCIVRVITHVAIKVILQQSNNQPSVFVVCDSTSIVTLSCQILKGREGYFIILIQEHLQLHHRDTQVRLVELIRNVPS